MGNKIFGVMFSYDVKLAIHQRPLWHSVLVWPNLEIHLPLTKFKFCVFCRYREKEALQKRLGQVIEAASRSHFDANSAGNSSSSRSRSRSGNSTSNSPGE